MLLFFAGQHLWSMSCSCGIPFGPSWKVNSLTVFCFAPIVTSNDWDRLNGRSRWVSSLNRSKLRWEHVSRVSWMSLHFASLGGLDDGISRKYLAWINQQCIGADKESTQTNLKYTARYKIKKLRWNKLRTAMSTWLSSGGGGLFALRKLQMWAVGNNSLRACVVRSVLFHSPQEIHDIFVSERTPKVLDPGPLPLAPGESMTHSRLLSSRLLRLWSEIQWVFFLKLRIFSTKLLQQLFTRWTRIIRHRGRSVPGCFSISSYRKLGSRSNLPKLKSSCCVKRCWQGGTPL